MGEHSNDQGMGGCRQLQRPTLRVCASQASPLGLSNTGPGQEHRILLAPPGPSCPVTHACCPLVIFATECASPSDSPGEERLKLLPPPLHTWLPLCEWVSLGVDRESACTWLGPSGWNGGGHTHVLNAHAFGCVNLASGIWKTRTSMCVQKVRNSTLNSAIKGS